MSEPPVRVVFSDEPSPQPFETLEQFAVRYYRKRIAEGVRDIAVNLTIAAAMWCAGFARQRHVTPRRVRRRKGLPLGGRRVRVRRAS